MTHREFLQSCFNSPVPGDKESVILELRIKEYEQNPTHETYGIALEAWVKYEEAKLKRMELVQSYLKDYQDAQ
jgi:hypothetical protein